MAAKYFPASGICKWKNLTGAGETADMTAGTVVILALQGPLASVQCPRAAAVELLTPIRSAKPRVVLNLGAVPMIDCSGIGLIAALCRGGCELGGDLRLLGVRKRPRQLLEVCGLLRVIRTFETEEAALASIVALDGPELWLSRTFVPGGWGRREMLFRPGPSPIDRSLRERCECRRPRRAQRLEGWQDGRGIEPR